MRRAVGVGAVAKIKVAEEAFKDKKTVIDDESVEKLQDQLEKFQTKLKEFAEKHQKVLKTDPIFRQEFIQMCSSIGVDPLASSKGYWTEHLGFGTFYYHLAVRCAEIILSGKDYHGGLIYMCDLLDKFREKITLPTFETYRDAVISKDDVIQAFKLMEVLGKSCGVLKTGETWHGHIVFCVPEEFSMDVEILIRFVGDSGKLHFSEFEIVTKLKWSRVRISKAVSHLLRDGIVWLDIAPPRPGMLPQELFWFPGLFVKSVKGKEAKPNET